MRPKLTAYLGCSAGLLVLSSASAWAQTAWDPNAIDYDGPPAWQQAAAAVLNRHLPTDSGYWVLGPLNLTVDLPDTMDLVRTTLRIIAPNLAGSRSVTQRLWMPTGGVALEELQPSDTLPHELPPGYPGRFLKGNIAGERIFVQVLTVQQHRWVLWAQRSDVVSIRELVTGSLAQYSTAITEYLAAVDSGRPTTRPPRASAYGLDAMLDLYAGPPDPVIRDREGYLNLLRENRVFTLDGEVKDVYGFLPGPPLIGWLEEEADDVLFLNRDGAMALQHRYGDLTRAREDWHGLPVVTGTTISSLRPGRYVFVVDRYGFMRVGPAAEMDVTGRPAASAATLAHGDPVRVAGELVLEAAPGEGPRVLELNVNSEEYFFSNRSMSLYEDVEVRSDRYVAALGHALSALDLARIPRDNILIRKF